MKNFWILNPFCREHWRPATAIAIDSFQFNCSFFLFSVKPCSMCLIHLYLRKPFGGNQLSNSGPVKEMTIDVEEKRRETRPTDNLSLYRTLSFVGKPTLKSYSCTARKS